MMDKKVADLIADALHQVGGQCIYGIVGDRSAKGRYLCAFLAQKVKFH